MGGPILDAAAPVHPTIYMGIIVLSDHFVITRINQDLKWAYSKI